MDKSKQLRKNIKQMKNKLSFRQSLIAGLWAAITGSVINATLFFIYHALGVITDTIFVQPGKPLSVISVILSSIIPALIAGMVFFLFETYTKKGFKMFTIVSIALLILSFLNPFLAIPGVSIAYALALCTMHVVVAVSLLYFIMKSLRKETINDNQLKQKTKL
jgi:membrane protein implicated in regulation of membrane protease activity